MDDGKIVVSRARKDWIMFSKRLSGKYLLEADEVFRCVNDHQKGNRHKWLKEVNPKH